MKYTRKNLNHFVDSEGFTLLEILVVLLIMALGSFFYLNQSNLGQRQKSPDRFLSDVKTLMYQQRLAAITTGVTHEIYVVLDKGERRIRTLDKIISIPESLQITFSTAADLVLSDQIATIEFNSDGSSSGGHLVARTNENAAELSVNWLTGNSTLKKVSLPQ